MGEAIQGSYNLKTFYEDWIAAALEKIHAYIMMAQSMKGVHRQSCTAVAPGREGDASINKLGKETNLWLRIGSHAHNSNDQIGR